MREKSRGREEKRVCKVFNNLKNIDREKWVGIKSILEIERTVKFKNKTTKEIVYFISSLSPKTGARVFNQGIRSRWNIESFHYIKDVVFGEDKSKVKTKNAPCNYSIIRNLVINIFRKNHLHKIQETIEKCANNVPFMMSLI